MAAAVAEVASEPRWHDVAVRVVPGVTAANAVAAAVGAPLGHDFAVISLSDRLKPWSVIERRIRAALAADLVIAIYNPGVGEPDLAGRRLETHLLQTVSPDRVVVLGRDVGGPEESVTTTTVGEFDPEVVDMRTLIVIGSSTTRAVPRAAGRLVYTPRRYEVAARNRRPMVRGRRPRDQPSSRRSQARASAASETVGRSGSAGRSTTTTSMPSSAAASSLALVRAPRCSW